MAVRAAILVLLLWIAMPAWAHGEQLIYIYGFVLYVCPGLALLLVRWHALWARVLSVLVLAVSVVILWWIVFPGNRLREVSPIEEWSLLFGPTLLALTLAVVLRVIRARVS